MSESSKNSPLRTQLETWVQPTLWTGAGAADLTKVLAPGVVSVHETATGKYTVTFQDVGGLLIDVIGRVHNATGTSPYQVEFTPGTYSATAKTVAIEVYDMATPSLADAPSGAKVSLTFVWAKNITL